jgi:hypothetical protein
MLSDPEKIACMAPDQTVMGYLEAMFVAMARKHPLVPLERAPDVAKKAMEGFVVRMIQPPLHELVGRMAAEMGFVPEPAENAWVSGATKTSAFHPPHGSRKSGLVVVTPSSWLILPDRLRIVYPDSHMDYVEEGNLFLLASGGSERLAGEDEVRKLKDDLRELSRMDHSVWKALVLFPELFDGGLSQSFRRRDPHLPQVTLSGGVVLIIYPTYTIEYDTRTRAFAKKEYGIKEVTLFAKDIREVKDDLAELARTDRPVRRLLRQHPELRAD